MEHYTALVLWHEREREYPRLIWLPVSSSLLRAGLGLGFCRHIISLVSTILSSAAGAQLLVSQHCLNPTWWNHHHHSSRQNVDMTRQYVSSMPLMCSSNPGGDRNVARYYISICEMLTQSLWGKYQHTQTDASTINITISFGICSFSFHQKYIFRGTRKRQITAIYYFLKYILATKEFWW